MLRKGAPERPALAQVTVTPATSGQCKDNPGYFQWIIKKECAYGFA